MPTRLSKILTSFIGITLFLSCEKDHEPVPDTPPVVTDSPVIAKPPRKKLLTQIHGDGGYILNYDSTDRLTQITTSSWRHPVEIYHNKDTISHVAFFSSDVNTMFIKIVAVFVFRPDKKLERVLYKAPLSSYNPSDPIFNPSNPYYSNANDGLVGAIDSLFYSSSGQLIEIKNTSRSITELSIKYHYDNSTRLSPSKISYQVNNHLREYKFTTNDMEHPAYKTCWMLPFINRLLGSTYYRLHIPIVPKDVNSDTDYWTQVKECITQYQSISYSNGIANSSYSSEFIYSYNSDSTMFQGKWRHVPYYLQYHFTKP